MCVWTLEHELCESQNWFQILQLQRENSEAQLAPVFHAILSHQKGQKTEIHTESNWNMNFEEYVHLLKSFIKIHHHSHH